MDTGVKRHANEPDTRVAKVPRIDNSDDDFITDDEEINKRLASRKLRKEQNVECFTSGLRDYGITKTIERAAG